MTKSFTSTFIYHLYEWPESIFQSIFNHDTNRFLPPYIYSDTLCSESGAAAAVLPVTTDFLLFITLLKSIICVTEFHPLIILSMSVQSVLIPSVLFRPGKWYSCTLNNERLEYLNTNFGFQNSDKQQKVCRNQEVSSC